MAVEAGVCNFVCFDNFQEQENMMAWQQQQQQEQQLGFELQAMGYSQNGDYSTSSSVSTTMQFSQDVNFLLEKQMHEFDLAIQIQSERLRRTLQESSSQQLTTLLQNYEPYITALISEKDQTISTAKKNNLILEDYLKNKELELATWKTKAMESEAEIAKLNNTLSQLAEISSDEESRCNGFLANDKCRVCRARRSCIVVLPCRHLCLCEFCEEFVNVCPVCESVKGSSVEVFSD